MRLVVHPASASDKHEPPAPSSAVSSPWAKGRQCPTSARPSTRHGQQKRTRETILGENEDCPKGLGPGCSVGLNQILRGSRTDERRQRNGIAGRGLGPSTPKA